MNRPSYDPIVRFTFQEMEASLASSARTEVDVLELGAGTGIFLESTLRFLREEAKATATAADERPPPPAYLRRPKLRFLCTEPHAPYVEHMQAKYCKLLEMYNEEADENGACECECSEALAGRSRCPCQQVTAASDSPRSLVESLSTCASDDFERAAAPCSDERTESSSLPGDACSSDSSGEGSSDEEASLGLSAPLQPLVEARALEAHAECLPLGDAQAKAVLCASSLHWFCNERAFREIHRVLIDNGVLGASVTHERKAHTHRGRAFILMSWSLFSRIHIPVLYCSIY